MHLLHGLISACMSACTTQLRCTKRWTLSRLTASLLNRNLPYLARGYNASPEIENCRSRRLRRNVICTCQNQTNMKPQLPEYQRCRLHFNAMQCNSLIIAAQTLAGIAAARHPAPHCTMRPHTHTHTPRHRSCVSQHH